MGALVVVGVVAAIGGIAWLLMPGSASAAPKLNIPPRAATVVEQAGINIPPELGSTPDAPFTSPLSGGFYQVVRGDTGVSIAGRAYSIPNDGSGARVRAWNDVKRAAKNRVLQPGAGDWDGTLVSTYPGYGPRGSGDRFPVIWIP